MGLRWSHLVCERGREAQFLVISIRVAEPEFGDHTKAPRRPRTGQDTAQNQWAEGEPGDRRQHVTRCDPLPTSARAKVDYADDSARGRRAAAVHAALQTRSRIQGRSHEGCLKLLNHVINRHSVIIYPFIGLTTLVIRVSSPPLAGAPHFHVGAQAF